MVWYLVKLRYNFTFTLPSKYLDIAAESIWGSDGSISTVFSVGFGNRWWQNFGKMQSDVVIEVEIFEIAFRITQ
jgi:hypothetical protein